VQTIIFFELFFRYWCEHCKKSRWYGYV